MICAPFSDLRSVASPEQSGAKAFNLAQLLSAGISVPEGVVISTNVFDDYLHHIGSAEHASSFFRSLEADGQSAEALHASADRLRQSVTNGSLQPALMQAISEYCAAGGLFAVRSSAPCEDGVTSSFAGQFDSVLNCDTPEAVSRAILEVWASLFGERAIAYALHRGKRMKSMAVIVQHQVDAVSAGVMFSRDPREDEGDIIVEYCSGLGERLVAGEITPGRFRLGRTDGTFVLEASPEEPVAWDPREVGTSEVLVDIALALERILGGPQDIEWSVDEAGKIFVVQSRPITTVPKAAERLDVWSNANIAENFPDPVCPMVESFVARGFGAYFRSLAAAFGVSRRRVDSMNHEFDTLIGAHGGRLYYNLSNIHALLYAVPCGASLGRYFNQFTGARDFPEPDRLARSKGAEAVEAAKMLLHIIWRYSRQQSGLRRFEQRVDEYATLSAPDKLNQLAPDELAKLLEGFLNIRMRHWTSAALSDAGTMVSYGLLDSLVADRDSIDINDLLKGLPGLASAAPVEHLWELSRTIQKDAGVAELIRKVSAPAVLKSLNEGKYPDFKLALDGYLDTWGFRSSGELMLVKRTPKEDPLPVLRLLKTYVNTDGDGPAEKSRQQGIKRKAATKRARQSMGLLPWILFSAVLRATQASVRLRERARMKQALLYTRLRHVALAMGDRLVADGQVGCAEDIFLLKLEEATACGNGAKIDAKTVKSRRHKMVENQTWTAPDSFELPKGETYQRGSGPEVVEPSSVSDTLTGLPACGGETTGTAAVVLDVADIDRICKDQILVTHQTDPGWASVFFLVKGLVIERGGLLSHGAIIAREYGIPAVVDVKAATKLIQDGDTVNILGDQGSVRIVRD